MNINEKIKLAYFLVCDVIDISEKKKLVNFAKKNKPLLYSFYKGLAKPTGTQVKVIERFLIEVETSENELYIMTSHGLKCMNDEAKPAKAKVKVKGLKLKVLHTVLILIIIFLIIVIIGL